MTPQTQKQQNPIKQYLDPYGEYRLNCLNDKGLTIWARTNTQDGVLAIIAEWRRLGFKHIEVWEPERYGVTQLWDVQESNLKSKRLSSKKVSLLEFVTAQGAF
jgi:hypothetical protein